MLYSVFYLSQLVYLFDVFSYNRLLVWFVIRCQIYAYQ